MKLRVGYKESDVGIIPEDWDVSSLGSMVTDTAPIRYGVVQIGPHVADGVPIVPIKYIKQIGETPLHRSSKLIEARYSGSRIAGNDILISVKGTIGRVGIVPNGFEGNIAREIARIRVRNAYDPRYVSYQLESYSTQQRILEAVVGTTRLEFSIAAAREFRIAIPPTLDEQHTIAVALGNADALIASLDALIAKKHDLKQAAMHQLLTGKTRLPGFTGGWEVKRLGDLLEYEQPTKYLVSSTKYDDSYEVPVLTAGKTFVLGRTNEAHGIFDSLPAIIFDDFTTASKLVDFPFKAKSSAMKILKPRSKDVNIGIVYELMQMIDFVMTDHKRYWISEFQKIEVEIPTPKEQAAISEVLSDMDADLAELKSQREKLCALKQGMMQELLTGRIRLV